MKKSIYKNLVASAIIFLLFGSAFTFAQKANAQPDLGINYVENTGLQAGNENDPIQLATNIVKYLMTFLGIIAVVIILLGGFKWMTAAGNDEKVSEAKKLLIAGMIGLAIILGAYVIVNFVIQTTTNVITSGTPA